MTKTRNEAPLPLTTAALLTLMPAADVSIAAAPVAADPAQWADLRVACAVYKAKTRQWKTDQLRALDIKQADQFQEYKNMEASKMP